MMEIKTGKEINDFFESGMCPDSFSNPPIEFYYKQKWVAVDDILKEIRIIDKWHSTHRTQNLLKLLQRELREIEQK